MKCSEVLQYSDGLSNKVSNVVRRHIENMKLLLVCILLLSHFFTFFRFYFLSMHMWLYSCLILQFMYFYCYVYMGGACGPYGGRERSLQGAGGETRGEETAGETKA